MAAHQLDLFEFFERALARREDPETSHAAAESIGHEKLTRLQEKVVEGLKVLGGSGTMEEVVKLTGIEWRTLTPRFRPLARKGVIRDSGRKQTASSGRKQIVWELTQEVANGL